MPIIEPRLFIHRNSINYGELQVVAGDSPVITCTNDAEIKMRISCSVVWENEFDYNADTIVPFITIDGTEYQVGEFVLTQSRLITQTNMKSYNLSGFDKTYLCKKNKVEERPFFPKGSLYTQALSRLIADSGITNYYIESTNYVFSNDREDWEPGTPYIQIINQLLSEINYNSIYMSLDGVVYCSKYRQPLPENVDISYINDPYTSILYDGSEIDIDAFDHPNVFHYSSENIDTDEILNAVAINNSPGNKFSIQRQGRVAVYQKVDSVPNMQALQEIADKARIDSMYSRDTIRYTTALNPVHQPFSIIELIKNEFSGIVQEKEWVLNMSYSGNMTHTGIRISYD